MSYDYLFKYVVIGNSGVGKSCMTLQFTDNYFKSGHEVTIGVDYRTQIINAEKKIIKLQIWDTTGQEKFRSITRSYYRRVTVALIIYDITNRRSFTDIVDWLNDLLRCCGNKITIAIIGNKSDLANNRKVSYKEASKFAKEHKCLFAETSAKNSINISDIFKQTSVKVCNKIKNEVILADQFDIYGIKKGLISSDDVNNDNKTQCCGTSGILTKKQFIYSYII